jgi:hypothetical protein
MQEVLALDAVTICSHSSLSLSLFFLLLLTSRQEALP